jgi:chemotaxis signal transduction protein
VTVSGSLTVDAAAELRRQFDGSFAVPVERARAGTRDLLAVRVGGDRCAIPLDAVARLARTPELTPAPDQLPTFLGIGTHQGANVAVYDLAGLTGRTRVGRAGWMVLTVVDRALALAFDDVDGYLRVPVTAAIEVPAPRIPGDLGSDGLPASSRHRSGSFLHLDGALVAVVDLPEVVAQLDDLVRPPGPKELDS